MFCALFRLRYVHRPYIRQITKPIVKPAVAEEFFSALTEHQHLERLDLDCVCLGMELGTKFCRDVLRRLPKLKILDLKVVGIVLCHKSYVFPFHVFAQMNNLHDDISDILVDAIFHTRLAQVYLAGNNMTQARGSNDSLMRGCTRYSHETFP